MSELITNFFDFLFGTEINCLITFYIFGCILPIYTVIVVWDIFKNIKLIYKIPIALLLIAGSLLSTILIFIYLEYTPEDIYERSSKMRLEILKRFGL